MGKSTDTAAIVSLVDRILSKQVIQMKVKIVIGLKLFKRRAGEIKQSIDKSTHYVETQDLIEELCGKGVRKGRMMEDYDSIFDELEKGKFKEQFMFL